jgi:hypothetical protein
MRIKISILIIQITILVGFINLLYGQLKHHQIGRLWQTMFQVGSIPTYSPLITAMSYPGGDFLFGKGKNMDQTGTWIGVKNWTNKFNQFKTFYVSEGGYKNYEAPDILDPVSNRKWVRQRLPLVDVNEDREQRTLDNRGSSTRSATLEADERIRTQWATDVGILVERNSYAFANRRHDSYIIQEYIFTNTGNANADAAIELPGQNLEGVYFGFWRTFIPSKDNGHEQMGGEADDWCHYYGNLPGDTLRGFWYVYDGDNQTKTFDDTGDPSEITGEFLAPQFVSFGVLYADTDYNNKTDDLNQPVTVNFWSRSRVHSHVDGDADQTLYLDLSSGVQSQGSDTGEFSHPYDPLIQGPQLLIAFGPYDIPFGEDIRIVLFEAIGSIDRRLAVDMGRNWKLGTLEWNGLTGDEAKNEIVATGRDSLHQLVRRAEWTWQHGLEAVPDGPESPNLRLNAGPGKVELEWYYGTYGNHDTIPPNPDVDTGIQDFAGYRVYRSEELFTNVYRKIWECGGSSSNPVTNKFVDRDVERGQSYFYYVTAFDDGSQNTSELFPGKSVESSHFSNRNFQFAAVPFEAARTQLDSVYVVPNPFHFQGLEYGGTLVDDYAFDPITGARPEDRITFVGLPAKAIIRIFTTHGRLIKTLHHPNPDNPQSVAESADEMWFQITDSWQTIKSGVYFYFIEGWDLEGNYVGSTTGKFVIIR